MSNNQARTMGDDDVFGETIAEILRDDPTLEVELRALSDGLRQALDGPGVTTGRLLSELPRRAMVHGHKKGLIV